MESLIGVYWDGSRAGDWAHRAGHGARGWAHRGGFGGYIDTGPIPPQAPEPLCVKVAGAICAGHDCHHENYKLRHGVFWNPHTITEVICMWI